MGEKLILVQAKVAVFIEYQNEFTQRKQILLRDSQSLWLVEETSLAD